MKVYLKLVVAPDGQKDLSNPHPSCGAVGLAIGAPHSSLEPEEEDFRFESFLEIYKYNQILFSSGVNCHKSWLS